MALKWVDAPPPANPGRHGKWAAEAAQLRKRPGKWALLTEDASSAVAHQIVNGKVSAFRGGRWEAVSRVTPTSRTSRGAIYVRYLGEQEDQS